MTRKIIAIIRMSAFIATLITTIPLFINYLMDNQPKNQLVTHLHVWFGLAFFIFAIVSMILEKKGKNKLKAN